MLVMLTVGAYLVWLWRRPIDRGLKQQHIGPLAVVGGLGLVVEVWLRFAPESIRPAYLAGELWGVAAVYLMTAALILATRARWLESWFGGLDRMYWWHKWTAIGAVGVLMIPHAYLNTVAPALESDAPPGSRGLIGLVLGAIALVGLLALLAVSIPAVSRAVRLRYPRWLTSHRFTGLLVLISVVHGLAIDDVIAHSTLLRVIFVAMGTVSLVSYAYAELIMRHRVPTTGAAVSTVERPTSDITDVVLTCDQPLAVTPGQFAFVRFAGRGWRDHPYSIAGQLPDNRVRVVIKAAGDETKRMHADLHPGMRATIEGPYGRFDHTLGGRRQVWIAGGIGITPFLGWLVVPEPLPPEQVDLFYVATNETTAVYAEELDRLAKDAPQMRVHHVLTSESGHLTVDQVRDTADIDWTGPERTDVFLCGPRPMIHDLARALHRAGVRRERIHREIFGFR